MLTYLEIDRLIEKSQLHFNERSFDRIPKHFGTLDQTTVEGRGERTTEEETETLNLSTAEVEHRLEPIGELSCHSIIMIVMILSYR